MPNSAAFISPIQPSQVAMAPAAQTGPFVEPSWVANAKQTIGTGVVPVYPMKTVHGGNQAEDTNAAPIGYKYDNGQSQYVYLDLAGKPTGKVENRGSGIFSQVTDMAKTVAPLALAALGANYLPGLLGGAEGGGGGLIEGLTGGGGAGVLSGAELAASAGIQGTAADALASLMGGGALDTSALAMGGLAGTGAETIAGSSLLGGGALANLMGSGTTVADLGMGNILATGAGAGAGVLPTVGIGGALAGLLGSNVIDTASLNLGDALTTAAGAGVGTAAGTGVGDFLNKVVDTGGNIIKKVVDTGTGTGTGADLLKSLLTGGAGLLQGQSAVDAAKIQADAIKEAAKTAADAAKFKPVGVTTAFGKSNFGYDANGNLISAGYELTPELAAQRDAILKAAGTSGMDWMKNTQTAGQGLFNLGQGYVAKTPEQAAADWVAAQQKVLQPAQDTAYARMQQNLANTGRGGLSIAQGTGMGAANPEAQAYYNALMQQNNQLAAAGQAEGRAATTFGQGLMSGGLDLVSQGYNPYKTQLGTAQSVEQAGQNALDISSTLAGRSATAGANAGQTLYQGGVSAAGAAKPANAYNPYADLLAGAAGNPTITDYLNKWITGV